MTNVSKPVITETKRDLAADLALCESATFGPWEVAVDGFDEPCVINEAVLIASELLTVDAKMIAAAREGWPHAIRRAMAAEAEVERLKQSYRRLHAVHDEQCARSAEYYGEIQRLRAFIEPESECALDTFMEIENLRKALRRILDAIDRGALVNQKMSAALDFDIRQAREALSDVAK